MSPSSRPGGVHAPAHARSRLRSRRRTLRGRLLGALAVVLAACGAAGILVLGRHPVASAVSRTTLTTSRGGTKGRGDRSQPAGPPLVQPTAARPLSVLVIGDSLGEDLSFGLEDVLAHDPRVVLHPEAVGSTGLANVAYYNWPASFARELRTYHPGLVIVFIGGNDAQGFDVGNRPALFGSPLWHEAYAARVRHMMALATAAGAHMLWLGMPPMAPSTNLTPDMAKLDGIYATVARSFPLVRFQPTWKLFETRAGQFAMALPDAAGQVVTVRDPDGVHLTMAGAIRAAEAAVGAVQRDWHVHL